MPKTPNPAKRVREEIEWQAGIFEIPARVADSHTDAEVLIWKAVDGAILGWEAGNREDLLARAGAILRDFLNRSVFLPGTLRVASEELAARLRVEITRRVELICAPTTELDATLAEMRRRITEGRGFSYLPSGASEEAVAAFYRAAAKLYRAKPWLALPESEDLIAVSVDELGLRDGVISVLGQAGQAFGISLFASADDFYGFLEFDAETETLADTAVPLLNLTFDSKGDLPAELALELETHRFEVASASAHPWLMAHEEESHEIRPPSEQELRLAEAICLALPELLQDGEALRQALRGEGAPVQLRVAVACHSGDLEVAFSTEIDTGGDFDLEPIRPEHPLLGLYYDLETEEEIDFEAKAKLDAQMFALFAASSHGAAFPEAKWTRLLLDLMAEDFATTIASLGPLLLYEALHELLPGDERVGPEDAEDLVAELRAFFDFLADDFGHELAAQSRKILDDQAAALLRSSLVDGVDNRES